jgi:hypothetical protein
MSENNLLATVGYFFARLSSTCDFPLPRRPDQGKEN